MCLCGVAFGIFGACGFVFQVNDAVILRSLDGCNKQDPKNDVLLCIMLVWVYIAAVRAWQGSMMKRFLVACRWSYLQLFSITNVYWFWISEAVKTNYPVRICPRFTNIRITLGNCRLKTLVWCVVFVVQRRGRGTLSRLVIGARDVRDKLPQSQCGVLAVFVGVACILFLCTRCAWQIVWKWSIMQIATVVYCQRISLRSSLRV